MKNEFRECYNFTKEQTGEREIMKKWHDEEHD